MPRPHLLLLCLALPCSVGASDMPSDARDFDALDFNRDGVIEETEAAFEPVLWAQFRSADSDGNLRISREEYERWKLKEAKLGPRLLLPPAKAPTP